VISEVLLIIAASSALPAAAPAQAPSFSTAKQFYQNCVEYHAIKGDDGSIQIDVLVNIAREACRIERTILEVVISKTALENDNTNNSDARIIERTVMGRVDDESVDHISQIISDMKTIRNSK
jgi:hypothetical protein